MAAKLTKKELKEPDFLQIEFKKLLDFLSRHRSKVYFLLALHLLMLAIVAGWSLYRMNYEKSALNAYNQVEALALKSSSQSEKAKLIESYRNVASRYPNSQAALHAYYQLGNLYFNTNQVDLSIRAYDEFIKRSSETNYLKIFAYSGQGYCYELKKDFNKALSSFQSAMKMPEAKIFEGNIYRDMARIYEEMNDKKNSLEYYRKSLEKTTDPTMSVILKRKIASLS